MMSIDLNQYLKEKQSLINLSLRDLIPVNIPKVIREAMLYSLEAGGKRLRPLLTIAVAETLGEKAEEVIEIACAVEMIHTYSLIHDDLPAMDDSDLRRGKATCHRAFNEGLAVLAGDGLLTLAFELVARYGTKKKNELKANQISLALAVSAGVNGMIGGQILDLEGEGSDLGLNEIDRIAALKTGALLRAAILCGAHAASAGSDDLQALTEYANYIGPAFQIIDDLLDYEGTEADLGKPVNADPLKGKATYPALLGVIAAREKAEELHRQAVEAVIHLSRPPDLLIELANRLVFRRR